jgi:hypothetical protein
MLEKSIALGYELDAGNAKSVESSTGEPEERVLDL